MFGWFQPKCPVDPAVKAWIEHGLTWLVGQFGWDRLLYGPVVLPTEEFFPDPYDGSADDVRRLLTRVCQYMDVDPANVDLAFYSEDRPTDRGLGVIESASGTAGLYELQDKRTRIWLESSQAEDPLLTVAVLAHELGHVHLLGSGRISGDVSDHEPLTDLATIMFGMGLFVANAVVHAQNYHFGIREGWRISRHGYLTGPMFGYGLSLVAWLRDEAKPDWAAFLRPDVRAPFQKGLAYLRKTGDAAVPQAGRSCDPHPWECPIALFPTLGIQWSPTEETSDTESQDELPEADNCFAQGWLHAQRQEWPEAIRAFSEAIRRAPDDSECYQERAQAYGAHGRYAEALTDAETAVRLNADDIEAYRVRGKAYLDAGQLAQAVADFNHYLQEEDVAASDGGRVARVYYYRGLAWAAQREWRRAIGDFTRAIRRSSDWPAPYEARAEAYYQLGMEAKAEADRNEAERLASRQ